MFHYYHSVAPFLAGEGVEEGEQPEEAEEEAEVGVQRVPAAWNPVTCSACCVTQSLSHFVLFLMYRARAQSGRLTDGEEMFAEFDKKCVGLESLTAPLIPP